MLLGSAVISLALVVGSTTADWSIQQWDAIIVGAGPAGIIGESCLSCVVRSGADQCSGEAARCSRFANVVAGGRRTFVWHYRWQS